MLCPILYLIGGSAEQMQQGISLRLRQIGRHHDADRIAAAPTSINSRLDAFRRNCGEQVTWMAGTDRIQMELVL